MELFNASQFSSKNDDALRDFELDVSSKKKAVKRSHPISDPAWDDDSAFPVSSAKFLEEKQRDFEVGDRVLLKGTEATGTVAEIDDKGIGRIAWDIPQSWHNPGAKDDICTTYFKKIKCTSLISAQELAPDSAMPVCSSDLNLQQSQKLMGTVQTPLNCDIPIHTTTETCEIYQDSQREDLVITCIQEDSTLLQRVPHAPHFQQKDSDLGQMMSATVSPQSSPPLENCNPGLQPLKMSPELLPAPHAQGSRQDHITEESLEALTNSGTMRNGWLSPADTLELPLLEKEFCWLPSPGALSSTGKGRPPGQTKQEGELKKLGLLQKDEVLNPDILCEWYGIPQNWLDPSELRAGTELLENNERQREIFSILESPQSHSEESCTLTQLPDNPIPEKFLEETESQREAVSTRKRRQRKGCLYKYIETKRLKDGTVASYPRVAGHREPSNPTHWRWGFNWEEKVDGEWKNRSLSVKLGAIPLIQSMQKEAVSLEEIIGFIKRSKSK